MPQTPIHQLLDLAAVHGFYLALLENVTGEAVPVPRGTTPAEREDTPVEQSVSILRRWLNVLDLAISPPMFRDALKDTLDAATAESLLRYYVLKISHNDVDRDKCDFINTFLYRNWRKQQGKSEAPAEAVELGIDEPLAYEGEIYTLLGEVEPPALPQEHMQLTREFDHLRLEVDEFFHFDKLMDSGIIGRVREIKHSFATSFYHPHVLANVAVYNAFFGRKFDQLFAQAANEIKAFAQTVQQSGGSMQTRLNDDVTVQHLADVRGEDIHQEEYGKAGDHLRRLAEFKKVVDIRRKGRYTAPLPMNAPAVASAIAAAEGRMSAGNVIAMASPPGAGMAETSAAHARSESTMAPMAPSPGHASISSHGKVEDHKIESNADVIRNFIAVADKSFANVVPLRNCSILLTPAEVDAFRNAYLDERSFRADLAAMVRRLVGTMATMMIELEDYKRKKNSAYLWKQHADSLKYFLEKTTRMVTEAKGLSGVCEQRGLAEKVRVLEATSERLRTQAQLVAKFLQG